MILRHAVLLVLLTATLVAAQSASDVRFGIKGTVLDAQSGKPIPQALVTVSIEGQNPNNPQLAISADLAGSFQIRNIPAGIYRLQASRGGYFDAALRNLPSSSTHKFTDAPDALTQNRTETVKLFLSRQSVLEGTVMDARGLPVLGQVQAFRTVVRRGRYSLEAAQGVSVGRTGAFRIVDLRPGKYYVGFSPDHSGGATQFLASLYPGVPTQQGAQVFEVGPGSEEHIHFRPSPRPAYKVRGTISAEGRNLTNIYSLDSNDVPFAKFYSARFDRDSGTVSAAGLFPGDYVLVVQGTDSNSRYFFHVGTQDDPNTNFIPLPAIQGTIRFDEPPRTQPQFSVGFWSATQSSSTRIGSDGSFALDKILPGTYEPEIPTTLPQYVKSVRQGRRDLLRDDLLVTTAGAEPIEIMIGQGAAHVKYSLANPAEAPDQTSVVALRNLGRSYRVEYRGPLNSRADSGNGVINGLPPGEYLFFAWNSEYEYADQLPYNEEEFLRKYSQLGQRLTVYGSEELNLIIERRLPPEAFRPPR